MPRSNSFSDSDGRSLTPDLEDEFLSSPVELSPPSLPPLQTGAMARTMSPHHEPHEPTDARPSTDRQQPVASPVSEARVRSLRSPRSPRVAVGEGNPTTKHMTPGDRFRSAVRKVMAMRRGSVAISRGRIGAEPGVDPRRDSANMMYGHIRQKCLIEVVDYSAVRSSFGRMTNQEFIRLLADNAASAKEPWVKVRWINVGGVSWDVISALAIKYGTCNTALWLVLFLMDASDMHPLAVEDLLHVRQGARSKADYYQRHLFLRILCHTLTSDEEASNSSSVTHLPRSSSPLPFDDEDDEDENSSTYEDSMAKGEDEKTMYGTPPTSRFTTKRSGTLTNAVRRRLSKDVEAPTSAPSPRLSNFPQQQRPNVRILHPSYTWIHAQCFLMPGEEGRAEHQAHKRAQEGRAREREDLANVYLPHAGWCVTRLVCGILHEEWLLTGHDTQARSLPFTTIQT